MSKRSFFSSGQFYYKMHFRQFCNCKFIRQMTITTTEGHVLVFPFFILQCSSLGEERIVVSQMKIPSRVQHSHFTMRIKLNYEYLRVIKTPCILY